MARVSVTDPAKLDLVEIWDYIGQDSPRAADRLIEEIQSNFERLARSPSIGRKRDELSPRLRSFPVGSYIIFYEATKGGILVLRVLSGYRDLDALFN